MSTAPKLNLNTTDEDSVLGYLLDENPSDIPPNVSRLLEYAPDSFFSDLNQSVGIAIKALRSKGNPVYPKTVIEFIGDDLPEGGALEIEKLKANAVSSYVADDAAARCVEEYQRELVLKTCQGARDAITGGLRVSTVSLMLKDAVDSITTGSPLIPDPLRWDDIESEVDYSENLLGDRLLERGQGLILFAPAGVGKSVASLQASIFWSAGLRGLHIQPSKPLKIVILQTEDSINDVRETIAGIRQSTLLKPEHIELMKQNLIILPQLPGGNADDMRRHLDGVCKKHRPDVVSINPLMAFATGDVTKDLGDMLYHTVDPIIKKHRVGFIGIHHTPKTNNRDTSKYGDHDHQYAAAGDARVANWPRAMMNIESCGSGVYTFRMSKRWKRAGWTMESEPVSLRYFKHAEDSIRWIDATEADIDKAAATERHGDVVWILPELAQPGFSMDKFFVVAKEKLNIGQNKARSFLNVCIEEELVDVYEDKTDNNRNAKFYRKSATVIQ